MMVEKWLEGNKSLVRHDRRWHRHELAGMQINTERRPFLSTLQMREQALAQVNKPFLTLKAEHGPLIARAMFVAVRSRVQVIKDRDFDQLQTARFGPITF